MNQYTIIGNLVRDPETGTVNSGANYTRFVVAVNKPRVRGQEQEAEFMRVTCWRGLADSCAAYLRKGRKVAVVGSANSYGWIRRDGSAGSQIEITAGEVEFLSSGGGPLDAPPEEPEWSRRQGNETESGTANVDPESGMETADPEDLPF